MKLILDASVVIAFYSEMQRPDLLRALSRCGFELLIPSEVEEELKKDKNYQSILEDIKHGVFKLLPSVPENELDKLRARFIGLHDGEIGVIWWAYRYKHNKIASKCVFDNGKARRKAQKEYLEVTGTIGLLEILCKKGIIDKDEASTLIKILKERGFRLPKNLRELDC